MTPSPIAAPSLASATPDERIIVCRLVEDIPSARPPTPSGSRPISPEERIQEKEGANSTRAT
jgi:hypothetical protein